MININLLLTATILGAGLAMDAFAVSVSNGMTVVQLKLRHAFKTALFFGFFQLLMTALGWLMGISFSRYVEAYAHWIAFFLLIFIGGKMLYETLTERDGERQTENPLAIQTLTVLAIATSIDALLVGVGFAAGNMDVRSMIVSCSVIGAVTFCLSFAGVLLGRKTGAHLQNQAGIFGGLILILIGFKILLEGLGIFHI